MLRQQLSVRPRRLSDERFRQEAPRDGLVRYCRWLRRCGYNDAESGKGSVPVLPIDHAEHDAKAPAQVAEALTGVPVVILAGHGVYAWGADLKQAYRWTCSLELSAKIYVLARAAAGL